MGGAAVVVGAAYMPPIGIIMGIIIMPGLGLGFGLGLASTGRIVAQMRSAKRITAKQALVLGFIMIEIVKE